MNGLSNILEPVHASLQIQLHIYSQLHMLLHYVGSLKSILVEKFILQKLEIL